MGPNLGHKVLLEGVVSSAFRWHDPDQGLTGR